MVKNITHRKMETLEDDAMVIEETHPDQPIISDLLEGDSR